MLSLAGAFAFWMWEQSQPAFEGAWVSWVEPEAPGGGVGDGRVEERRRIVDVVYVPSSATSIPRSPATNSLVLGPSDLQRKLESGNIIMRMRLK